jgi:hypothetical protein
MMPRRDIDLSRAVPPILSYRRRLRTFHHRRDYRVTSGGDMRPAFTLDKIVYVSVPLIRFAWPDAVAVRSIEL